MDRGAFEDRQGEAAPAWDALTATMYEELRAVAAGLMRGERANHTLEPTAVANEACLRLARHGLPEIPREQQLALAARVLQQVLIDHSRKHNASKRGGGLPTVRLQLPEGALAPAPERVDFSDLHRALTDLRELHPRQAEIVTLKVLAGLNLPQIAGLVGVSLRTAEGDWAVARAWMRRRLAAGDQERSP